MKQVKITTEFITLGQLLKIVDIASSGGEAKILVKELDIKVDGEKEDRRGRKLYLIQLLLLKVMMPIKSYDQTYKNKKR